MRQVGEHTYTVEKRQPSVTPPKYLQEYSTMEQSTTLLHTSKGRVSEAIKCAVSTVKGVDSGRFSSCSPPTSSQVFEPSDSTLLRQARPPCRPTLDEYKD